MATIIAAAVAKARRDIQHYFFSADAVRPERAVRFEPQSRLQQRQFEAMLSRGVIREAKPGQYWIDIPVYDTDLRARFMMVRLVLLAVMFALLVGMLVAMWAAKGAGGNH